jgi:hypothetical protein
VFVFFAGAARAQGPGFPNVARTKGQLISGPLLTSIGRTAVLAYQQGLVVVNPEAPESAPGSDLVSRSLDISNPAAPVATAIPFLQPNSWIAAHGYWQEGVYLRGLSGGDATVELVSGVPRVVQRNAPDPPQFPPPVQGVPFPGRGLLFQGLREIVEADAQRRQQVDQHQRAVTQGDGLDGAAGIQRSETGKQTTHRQGQEEEAHQRRRPQAHCEGREPVNAHGGACRQRGGIDVCRQQAN